ncbi:uncharacterized protein LOC120432218 [Culex pipiens pallens]|uniref:uncharacterized protein LOC120432218 n=1 Tax=Culex pipiens pallens TaxID=42434 RepID=UPI001953D596|nr:uncharacterized protein LOC120432218 [Culex pipiens pallens]
MPRRLGPKLATNIRKDVKEAYQGGSRSSVCDEVPTLPEKDDKSKTPKNNRRGGAAALKTSSGQVLALCRRGICGCRTRLSSMRESHSSVGFEKKKNKAVINAAE